MPASWGHNNEAEMMETVHLQWLIDDVGVNAEGPDLNDDFDAEPPASPNPDDLAARDWQYALRGLAGLDNPTLKPIVCALINVSTPEPTLAQCKAIGRRLFEAEAANQYPTTEAIAQTLQTHIDKSLAAAVPYPEFLTRQRVPHPSSWEDRDVELMTVVELHLLVIASEVEDHTLAGTEIELEWQFAEWGLGALRDETLGPYVRAAYEVDDAHEPLFYKCAAIGEDLFEDATAGVRRSHDFARALYLATDQRFAGLAAPAADRGRIASQNLV